jgi:hypothetical protein
MAIVMTQPLAALRDTHLITSRDTMAHYWNGWWAKEALTEGLPFFHTSQLFYPQGVSLVYQNIAWLNVAAWLALQLVMGGLAAYNTTLLVYLALCGFVAFLLTRYLTRSTLAAALAAVVYQNWPARLTRMNFPNLVNTVCMPLSLLFLIRTLREEKWYDAALTGLFVALCGYTRWQQLIPATIVISIYLTVTALQGTFHASGRGLPASFSALWKADRRKILLIPLAGLVAALVLLPPALMLIEEQSSSPTTLVETQNLGKVADVLAYVTPAAGHPLVRRWTTALHDQYYHDRATQIAYVGLIPLLLVLVAASKSPRETLPWAAAALCLLLLGLGPILRVNGQGYPDVPTLYALADKVVPLSLIRVPARFNVFLALPVAVLAGYGALPLLDWARRRASLAPLLLSVALGLVILVEYLPGPMPIDEPPVSPFYDELAAQQSDFAVLNVPILEKSAKLYMLAQTRHHRPIMQGHVSRMPPDAFSTIESNPWLAFLYRTNEMRSEFTDVSRQLAFLTRTGVRILMLHKTEVAADQAARWRRYLLIEPTYEDDILVAYRTEPKASQDFTLTAELMPGLGPIRVITSTSCLNPGGVLEVDVGWGTSAPPNRDVLAELALASDDGTVPTRETYPLSAAWPTSEWPADAAAWGYYTLTVDSTAPRGTYSLTLGLADPSTGQTLGSALGLGTITVRDQPCTFPTPSDAIETNAVYGNRLRLLGYQLRRDGHELHVTLYWRSEQRMVTDYKIFVHVLDLQTKRPVAQDDAPPRRGTYRTPFWPPAETVRDSFSISLRDVPPGTYGVAVGVYDPTTMERLPLVANDGPHPDGRLELPGETIVIEGNDG